MRKQTKIVAITSAAALLALGASFTAMAGVKGTWKMEDGEWYCYDSDGEVIENEFCVSNGKDYYVGDDGRLVTSDWVEDDGDYYFVNSAGQKVTNEWRYLTPYDDDDDDEQWFYFKANGKRAEDTKLEIGGKTYFFNADGEMLTGWVQSTGDGYDEATSDDVRANSDTYYCGEDGARLSKEWIYTYAPSVDLDDIDSEDEEHWYYIKSSGKPATRQQKNIDKQTYFFSDEGVMLYGWVALNTDSNAYEMIWNDDEDTDGSFGTPLSAYKDTDVYFCGTEDQGYMKKDKWICEYNNMEYGEDDSDNDQYWFYINSSGKVYIPDGTNTINATRRDLDDGEGISGDVLDAADVKSVFGSHNYYSYVEGGLLATEKKINSKTYWFDQYGQMLCDLITDDDTGLMYYFGGWNDGARKDGSLTMVDDSNESYRFYFATDDKEADYYYNAAGINGAKNGKLYWNGMLVKASDDKYELKTLTIKVKDGEDVEASFIVNKSGTIQSSAKKYEEDDDVLIDATKATFYGDKDGENIDALKNSVTGAVVK